MDLLRERIESALQAVAALNELRSRSLDDRIVRDALIQRFQFTFEAVRPDSRLVGIGDEATRAERRRDQRMSG